MQIPSRRHKMFGFPTDYSNFKNQYEHEIENKTKFISQNPPLIEELFEKIDITKFDINGYSVNSIFVGKTSTFYVLNGKTNTVTISTIEEFIANCYRFPD